MEAAITATTAYWTAYERVTCREEIITTRLTLPNRPKHGTLSRRVRGGYDRADKNVKN